MRLFQDVLQRLGLVQTLLDTSIEQHAFTISEQWHVLGPFSIGTREAAWGADPLESVGGFHNLAHEQDVLFRSSLTVNGTTTWATSDADVVYLNNDAINVKLSVAYPEIGWQFQQQVYGWAALQWQGWARGSINVNTEGEEVFNLNLEHILELWVDDEHYFGGDFYGFHRAPIILRLAPGVHRVDVRLVRDVRSMGGITDNPSIDVGLLLTRSKKSLRQTSQVLYPDRLDDWKGPMSSTYASVVLRNDNDTDVFVHSIEAKHNTCSASLVTTTPVRLVPGQARPIAFQIDCVPGTSAYLSLDLHFGYYADAIDKHQHSLFVGILARRPLAREEPHVITYLHPAGIISYAILRPPNIGCKGDQKLPVLLSFHGAGVDVDSEDARHSLDDIDDVCAWTLLPSGSTAWSGDDWHNWGWADVQSAIDAIPQWIEQTEWSGPVVDTTRWLVAGHSNGGQGVWYALTHHPDNIIAAAPISGYSSIQNYVPYTFWQPTDPARTAVVQAQLNDYRHELLLTNAKGIPVLQQHGAADDNVPTYHSRLMYDLVHRSGAESTYVELAGKPHWWDGVMTTSPLASFYRKQLSNSNSSPFAPVKFTLVAANPAGTGSKHGVTITSLITPGQLGYVHVDITHEHTVDCRISTNNIESIELDKGFRSRCDTVHLDSQILEDVPNMDQSHVHRRSQIWTIQPPRSSNLCHRAASQYGGLEAILRTNGSFQVVQHSTSTRSAAVQVANNLLQYYSADAAVAASYDEALKASGNILSIVVGSDMPLSILDCPSTCRFGFRDSSFAILRGNEVLHAFNLDEEDIVAATFLRPLPDHRLEMVVWSKDLDSLSIATRLLPLMTGSGQPDFIFTTRSMLHRGLEGVFALGFLNSSWCPASNSFFASALKL